MKDNCLIIAGEQSGEEHAQSFLAELKSLCPHVDFWGVGGEYFEKQDVELIYHLKDFSSIGFTSVILKIPFYLKALRKIRRMVKARKCKCAILIDFQDFNFRLAKKLKEDGVEILYYVAPQAWAWKEYRAEVLGKIVNTLFTILPFEKKWFMERGVKNAVGLRHPIYERFLDVEKVKTERKNLLLLPGSRNIEVENLLPVFISVAKEIKKNIDLSVTLVKSKNVRDELYAPYLKKCDEIIDDSNISDALSKASFSLAASGTVTLATALFRVPTVVTYKVSPLNWWVFKTFVKYKGPVSLANIVHQKRIFPELIQEDATVDKIKAVISDWIENPEKASRIEEELSNTKQLLEGDDISVATYMGKVLSEAYREESN